MDPVGGDTMLCHPLEGNSHSNTPFTPKSPKAVALTRSLSARPNLIESSMYLVYSLACFLIHGTGRQHLRLGSGKAIVNVRPGLGAVGHCLKICGEPGGGTVTAPTRSREL